MNSLSKSILLGLFLLMPACDETTQNTVSTTNEIKTPTSSSMAIVQDGDSIWVDKQAAGECLKASPLVNDLPQTAISKDEDYYTHERKACAINYTFLPNAAIYLSPDKKSKKIATLPLGTRVKIITSGNSISNDAAGLVNWYLVQYQDKNKNKIGYIEMDFLAVVYAHLENDLLVVVGLEVALLQRISKYTLQQSHFGNMKNIYIYHARSQSLF